MSRRPNASGSVSGREDTTAARADVAAWAASKASSVAIQAAGSQRSSRGRSSTSRLMPKPASNMAVKQAVEAGRSPQM